MKPSDMIVIVPSRGRPASLEPLAQAWSDTKATAELLIAVDDDDPTLDQYQDESERLALMLSVAPRLRMVGTLNLHAVGEAWSYDAVGFMGDDHRPRTVGWDHRFAETLSGGAGIVYGNDLLQGEKMATAVMMTSDIIETLGYMAPPTFTHLCVDLVWKDWGVGMGRITYLDDVVIEHVHPANGKANLDATYEEVNSSEMVTADSQAYYDYRDNQLQADLEKLRRLP